MPVDVSVLTALAATTPVDTFNRADETPLSDGGKWTNQVLSADSTINTTSNALFVSAGSTDCSAYRNDGTGTFSANMSAMVTLLSKVSTDNGIVGIYIALQGAGLGAGTPNGYRGEIRIRTTGDEWRIQRIDAGIPAVISSGTIQEVSTGDSFAVVRSGNDIELWWLTGSTWTFIVSVTDATYTLGGQIGVHVNDLGTNDSLTDNIRGNNTAAASTTLGAPSPPVIRVRLRAY